MHVLGNGHELQKISLKRIQILRLILSALKINSAHMNLSISLFGIFPVLYVDS